MQEVLYVESKKISSIDSDFTGAPKTDADHDLIEQAKSDPDAFGELYERYYNRILNYIYRRMPDVKIAEELTSNTFYNVLRALPKYRQKRSFHAWIYRIATNEVNMYLRSAKNRSIREKDFYTEKDFDRIYFISPGIETKEEKEEKKRRFQKLNESLNELPEKYRTVLVLRYFEEMKIDEIAQVTGKRTGTVKSLIHRGLKRLRATIDFNSATNP